MAGRPSKTKRLAKILGLIERFGCDPSFSLRKVDQEFRYLMVLDFESTCWKDSRKVVNQEIIEFPAVLLDLSTGKIVSQFQQYVQPAESTRLSDFCKELTGISQAQVDAGIPLATCLHLFSKWVDDLRRQFSVTFAGEQSQQEAASTTSSTLASLSTHHGNGASPGRKPSCHTCALATWSDWDLGVCLLYECRRKQIRKPTILNQWIDIRAVYRTFYNRKPKGLAGALSELAMVFDGREHCGLDDARNTALLCSRMTQDGHRWKITKTLESPQAIVRKPPTPPTSTATLNPTPSVGASPVLPTRPRGLLTHGGAPTADSISKCAVAPSSSSAQSFPQSHVTAASSSVGSCFAPSTAVQPPASLLLARSATSSAKRACSRPAPMTSSTSSMTSSNTASAAARQPTPALGRVSSSATDHGVPLQPGTVGNRGYEQTATGNQCTSSSAVSCDRETSTTTALSTMASSNLHRQRQAPGCRTLRSSVVRECNTVLSRQQEPSNSVESCTAILAPRTLLSANANGLNSMVSSNSAVMMSSKSTASQQTFRRRLGSSTVLTPAKRVCTRTAPALPQPVGRAPAPPSPLPAVSTAMTDATPRPNPPCAASSTGQPTKCPRPEIPAPRSNAPDRGRRSASAHTTANGAINADVESSATTSSSVSTAGVSATAVAASTAKAPVTSTPVSRRPLGMPASINLNYSAIPKRSTPQSSSSLSSSRSSLTSLSRSTTSAGSGVAMATKSAANSATGSPLLFSSKSSFTSGSNLGQGVLSPDIPRPTSINGGSITPPLCACGKRVRRCLASNPGPNQGRTFYTCAIKKRCSTGGGSGLNASPGKRNGCGYFQWESRKTAESSRLVLGDMTNTNSSKNSNSIRAYSNTSSCAGSTGSIRSCLADTGRGTAAAAARTAYEQRNHGFSDSSMDYSLLPAL